jgi:transcriptional regulator with XRE-family HTH domain
VGAAIKALRVERNLSARALSAKASLSAAYVTKVENGAVEPSLKAFARLAVALNMTMHEVWTVVVNEGSVGSAFLSHPLSTVTADVS